MHELVAHNAFRTLGLPATASWDEVQRAEGSLRRSLKLGVNKPLAWDLPWLGALARTEADVREAVGRLTTSPAMRLEQRLFWFEREPPAGPAMPAAPPHLSALLGLLGVFRDRAMQEEEAWRRCVDAWQSLARQDDYWATMLHAEVASGFEPAADAREVEALRERSVDRVLDGLTGLVREALESGESSRGPRALELLRGAGLSPKQLTRCENALFGASEDALIASCAAIRRESAEGIQRDAAQARANLRIAARAASRFESEVSRQLDRLLALSGRESATGGRLAEAASTCLSGLARDATWADDYGSAVALLDRARALLPDNSSAVVLLAMERERASESALQQRHSARTLLSSTVPEVRFEEVCASLRFNCRDQVRQEQGAAVQNRRACKAALERYDQDVLPELNRLLDKHRPDGEAGRRIRIAAAMCLLGIGMDLTWANEFKLAERTFSQAMALAPDGTDVHERVRRALQKFPEAAASPVTLDSARMKTARTWESLSPISAAPMLRTVNGFGCMLYGSADPEPIPGTQRISCLSTYYFTALFIPIFPIARYRVIKNGGSYSFLYKVPLSAFDRWHLSAAAAFALFVLFSMMSGAGSSSRQTASAYSNSSYPAPRYDSSAASGLGSAGPTGLSAKSLLKSQIETNRRRLGALEQEAKKNKSEIDRFQGQMRSLKSKIEETESNARMGLEFDEHGYQQAIDRYNKLVKQNNALVAKNQSILDEYDPLVTKTNGMIADYNHD